MSEKDELLQAAAERVEEINQVLAKDDLPTFQFRPAYTTATAIRIEPSFYIGKPIQQTYLLDWSWTLVPWWVRLLGLVRLPYDVARFVVTGRFMFIPWPWRW